MNSKLLVIALSCSALISIVICARTQAVDPAPCDSKCRERKVFYEYGTDPDSGDTYSGYYYFKVKDCLGCTLRFTKNYCKPADGDENVNNACLRPAGSENMFLNKYWVVTGVSTVCDFPQFAPYSIEAGPVGTEPNGDGIDIILSKCSLQQQTGTSE